MRTRNGIHATILRTDIIDGDPGDNLYLVIRHVHVVLMHGDSVFSLLRFVYETVLKKVKLFRIRRLHGVDHTGLVGDAAKYGIPLVDVVKSALIDAMRKVVVAEEISR